MTSERWRFPSFGIESSPISTRTPRVWTSIKSSNGFWKRSPSRHTENRSLPNRALPSERLRLEVPPRPRPRNPAPISPFEMRPSFLPTWTARTGRTWCNRCRRRQPGPSFNRPRPPRSSLNREAADHRGVLVPDCGPGCEPNGLFGAIRIGRVRAAISARQRMSSSGTKHATSPVGNYGRESFPITILLMAGVMSRLSCDQTTSRLT